MKLNDLTGKTAIVTGAGGERSCNEIWDING